MQASLLTGLALYLSQPKIVFPATVDGASGVSCATAFSRPVENSYISAWILGFWTGLNVNSNVQVGGTTDSRGVIGEIELDCRKTPSLDLLQSTFNTWSRLRKLGR